jgi:hypothetical protein
MKRGGEQVVEVPPDFDVWELVENKKSNQQEGNRGVNCFVAHGARVCFLKAYYTGDKFYTLMTRIGSQPLDVVVFNFGVRVPSLRRLNLSSRTHVPQKVSGLIFPTKAVP